MMKWKLWTEKESIFKVTNWNTSITRFWYTSVHHPFQIVKYEKEVQLLKDGFTFAKFKSVKSAKIVAELILKEEYNI